MEQFVHGIDRALITGRLRCDARTHCRARRKSPCRFLWRSPPSLDNRIRYVSTFFSPLLSFLFHLGTRRLDSLFVTRRDRSGCHLFQGKQVVRRAILGSSVVHRLLAAFDQNSLHSLTVSKENIVFNDFFIYSRHQKQRSD